MPGSATAASAVPTPWGSPTASGTSVALGRFGRQFRDGLDPRCGARRRRLRRSLGWLGFGLLVLVGGDGGTNGCLATLRPAGLGRLGLGLLLDDGSEGVHAGLVGAEQVVNEVLTRQDRFASSGSGTKL